jgi:hypothetical protein
MHMPVQGGYETASSDLHHAMASLWGAGCCECAMLCTAAAGTDSAFAPGRMPTWRDVFGLLEIFVSRAPEEETTGDFSDRHRNVERCGDAEDAMLHRRGPCALGDRQAGSGVVQRFDLFLEGVIEFRVHPGPAAHPAGFV